MDDAEELGGCLVIIILIAILVLLFVKGCSSDEETIKIGADVTIETILGIKEETDPLMSFGDKRIKKENQDSNTLTLEKKQKLLDKDVLKLEKQLKKYQNAD